MNLDAIRERYQQALDAKPSKGDYTPAGIDALTDSVCDIPDLLVELGDLLAEVDRLTRWKAEALPVMTGLQELGKALGLTLGESITGPSAVDAAHALRARAEAAEHAVQRVRELHTPEVAYDSEHHDCEPSECDRAGEGKPYERCAHCSGFAWEQLWPCSTIRALDGR